MNVNLWGPSMWVILQNISFMMDKQNRAPKYLFHNLQVLLPCPACRRDYIKFYAQLPWQPGHTAKYTYELHKLVNRKLNNQQIEKASQNILKKNFDVRMQLAANTFQMLLQQEYTTLFPEPTFEVVQKRFEINYTDSVPEKDIRIVLLALSMDYSTDHYDILRQWLIEVNQYLMSPSIDMYLNEYTNNKESLLRTIRRIKYNNEMDPKGNLIKAGACLPSSCV